MINMDFISSFRKPFQRFKQRNGMIWFPRERLITEKLINSSSSEERESWGRWARFHKGIMSAEPWMTRHLVGRKIRGISMYIFLSNQK